VGGWGAKSSNCTLEARPKPYDSAIELNHAVVAYCTAVRSKDGGGVLELVLVRVRKVQGVLNGAPTKNSRKTAQVTHSAKYIVIENSAIIE